MTKLSQFALISSLLVGVFGNKVPDTRLIQDPIVRNKLDGNAGMLLKWESVRKVERR
jgi:hypothetical protein